MSPRVGEPVAPACPDDLADLEYAYGGLECRRCRRLFPIIGGITELLPLEAFQETSEENTQLKSYSASFSHRTDRLWYRPLGVVSHLLGNGYLYSWAARAVDKFADGQ